MHVALFAAGTDDVDVRQAARALVPTRDRAGAADRRERARRRGAGGRLDRRAAIDYVGGALRGIEGWRLSPGHFAERHGLIVIIALGESIVAIGVGAAGLPARRRRARGGRARRRRLRGALVGLLRRGARAGRASGCTRCPGARAT